MKIVNHRIEGAPFVPTSKQGGIIKPRAIVLHHTAGWSAEGAIHTLAKSERKASAHIVQARDGKFTQIVPFNRKAWHAGPSKFNGRTNCNDDTIGIEIDSIGYLNIIERNKTYKDLYGNTVKQGADGIYVSGKRRAPGKLSDWMHYVHPRVGTKLIAWEPYYEAQLLGLDDLIPALLKAYPSIKYITTHEVIDTRGWKTDVHPGFPFSRYSSLGAEMVLGPHAVKLPRPVVLPKAPINLPVIGPAPVKPEPVKPQALEEKPVAAAPVPSIPDEPEDDDAPWIKFFGKKIAFEDAWNDNADEDDSNNTSIA